ncbi:hypothetical protein HK104_011057, partial [Borealophlyctis nickersoniae]
MEAEQRAEALASLLACITVDDSLLEDRSPSPDPSMSSTQLPQPSTSNQLHNTHHRSAAILKTIWHGTLTAGATISTIFNKATGLVERYSTFEEFRKLPKKVKIDIKDPKLHPEIIKKTKVSRENRICAEEQSFQKQRRDFICDQNAFAAFIGVAPADVDPRDIPIIGVGGSGGGFKAMIATAGYLKAMKDTGMFDCVMYIAGVSGSCWALANLYTAAESDPTMLVNHLLRVLPHHPADPFHIDDILSANPSVRVPLIFGGLVQKRLSGLPRGVVDMYGALLTAHFFAHPDGKEFRPLDFKLSAQRRWMEGGKAPMPIYTAVRHERPWKAREAQNLTPQELEKLTGKSLSQLQSEYDASQEREEMDEFVDDVKRKAAWWQWFEFSPFEFGCDELKVWVPTWASGRRFLNLVSVDRMPEQSFTAQIGLTASAMCAPFTSMVETFQRSDGTSSIGASLRKYASKLVAPDAPPTVQELLAKHPVHSSFNWNPLYTPLPGMKPGLKNSERIQLIDAGVDNNLPLYPFTRPGRDVDIIIIFDSSADVERN